MMDKKILEQLDYVMKYIVTNKWKYALDGHPNTWEASRSKKVSNCSHAVSMALQRAGVLKAGQRFYFGTKGVIHFIGDGTKDQLYKYYDLIPVNKNWRTFKKEVHIGDVIGWSFHTSVYKSTAGGKYYFYDAGRHNTATKKIGGVFKNCMRALNMDGSKVYYVLRIKEQYRTPVKKRYSGTFPKLPERGYFKTGDVGAEVLNLEKFLRWALGLKSDFPDGQYGAETVKRVKEFQKKVKLPEDGLFGKKTLAAAKKYSK